MPPISPRDRLRYRWDNLMSRGPIALIVWLFLISLAVIALVSLVVHLAGIAPTGDNGAPPNFAQIAWMSLMRTLDAGTMGGDTGSWLFLLAMFVVTLGGIFVVSTLIGVLTTGIEGRLDELRKGRSLVAEQGHTVILGWSPQIFVIVSELVQANANRPRACIAILAPKDKVEMQDELAARVGATGHTRIVCRTGNPIDMTDLSIVNPYEARAIIILSPEADDADAHVVKALLALTNHPREQLQGTHIVAAMRESSNVEVAHLVGQKNVELVQASELIPRIMAQTCRQSGLSVAYTDLMDFGGDEIYFQEEPQLVGTTFGAALLAYEDSAIMGLRFRDGRVQLLPPMDTRISAGDKLIAISEDDDTVLLSGLSDYGIDEQAIAQPQFRPAIPERALVLGWNERAPRLIQELDAYVAPGSEVLVVTAHPDAEAIISELSQALGRQSVNLCHAETTDRRVLEDLSVTSFTHVIVLACERLSADEADARTLITLLHLRRIADEAGHPFSIVSEIVDARNRELAEVTHADDFVVSSKLVSSMLTQLAENRELAAVFEDLFDPEGAELYLKPASDYILPSCTVSFYTVVEAARRRGQVALGYRLKAEAGDVAHNYGVHINPAKSALVTLGEMDCILVLAKE